MPTIDDEGTLTGEFVLPMLVPGEYSMDIGISDSDKYFIDTVYSAVTFNVVPTNYLETTQIQFDGAGASWSVRNGNSSVEADVPPEKTEGRP